MKKLTISACALSVLLLAGCVAKPPIATESEVRDAASFALNVDASQVAISDIR